jgi:hypothetical protein
VNQDLQGASEALGPKWLTVDLSISRVGPGSGRAKKNRVFQAEKILPTAIPWDVSGLSFRARLGRAACAFYTVK